MQGFYKFFQIPDDIGLYTPSAINCYLQLILNQANGGTCVYCLKAGTYRVINEKGEILAKKDYVSTFKNEYIGMFFPSILRKTNESIKSYVKKTLDANFRLKKGLQEH